MSSLLENALDSIRVGVQAYESHERAQLLSSVRNVHSGVLLLYKEALRRLSPEGSADVLVKEHIEPRRVDGKLTFVGAGAKTATTATIKARFKGLGISTDWNRLFAVEKVRNEVEHHYTETHEDAIKGLIADAFVLVRDFLANELEEQPVELLGHETWEKMLNVAQVLERERAECAEALRRTTWGSEVLAAGVKALRCDECGSPLLVPGPTGAEALVCRSCGVEESRDSFAERAVEHQLRSDRSPAPGDPEEEGQYVTCPFCQRETYILAERQCAACGEVCAHVCSACGQDIPASELSDGSICGYCEHMSSKR